MWKLQSSCRKTYLQCVWDVFNFSHTLKIPNAGSVYSDDASLGHTAGLGRWMKCRYGWLHRLAEPEHNGRDFQHRKKRL
ncbi:hypothetical protein NDU88_003734 [Pleurodeles waltl]|uniref:Uncharacterized protein n=1 Tax=Pleurodeles waltl TaxID=8319 RepID=A0AAV7WUG3_PLEWA|nr:hypothetical protein NDU88_003734 [Pleurodeles waltl]